MFNSLSNLINRLFGNFQEEEDEEEDIAEYWFDQTNKKILNEDELSGGAPDARDATYRLVATGLRSDSYSKDLELDSKPCKNVAQKKKRLRKYRTQTPRKGTLVEANNATSYISSETTLQYLMADIDSKDYLTTISDNCADGIFYSNNWLHLKTPNKFGYSLAILLNYTSHGLLHTFIRHWPQWEEVIPSLMQSEYLKPIKQHLNEIANATNEADSKKKINSLNSFLLPIIEEEKSTYKVVLALFLKQIKIFHYLIENIKSDKYLGEKVTDNCYIQVKFKVDENRILHLAVSKQLYPPVSDFDKRPVRTVTTAFFTSNESIIAKVWK